MLKNKHHWLIPYLVLIVWLQLLTGFAAYSSSTTYSAKVVELANAGTSLMEAGNYEAAIDKFKQALGKDPNVPEIVGNYALALMHQKKYEDALVQLDKAISLNPDMSISWLNKGSCHNALGQSKEALHAYKRYLELAPDGKSASQVKTEMAAIENRLFAERNRNEANEKNSSSADELTAKAKAEIAESQAKIEMGKAEAVRRNLSPAQRAAQLNNEAGQLDKQKKYLLAAAKLEEAYQLVPSENHKENLGIAYQHCAAQCWTAGNLDEAENYYKKSIALLENCSDKNFYNGLLADYKNFEKAKTTAADPKYSQAMDIAKEARSLADAGKNKEAATKFKEALALLPDNPELLVRYGAALMNGGDNEKALVEFQKAISLHPDYSLAWGYIGNCDIRLQCPAEAIDAFIKYLQSNPGEPVASQIRQKIQTLQTKLKSNDKFN